MGDGVDEYLVGVVGVVGTVVMVGLAQWDMGVAK